MDCTIELEALWSNELSDIRNAKFTQRHDEEIRRVLSQNFDFGEKIPLEIVKYLWFMPMYLEWQIGRVSDYLPDEDQRFRRLTVWV